MAFSKSHISEKSDTSQNCDILQELEKGDFEEISASVQDSEFGYAYLSID
jgi:hypothetical protein